MSQSCYENKANNIKEEGNVTPFSADIDSRAVQTSRGSSSPIEVTEDKGENQLAVYDSKGNDTEEEVLPFQSQPLSSKTQLPSPSIGAFTVQCASCFKWRLIPSMQKYEEIREKLLENPFFCETACEWKPDMSCDVPADIYQDGTRLWAIDKPNISRPPSGWQRLLRIRGEGGTRFADVYVVILLSFMSNYSFLLYVSAFLIILFSWSFQLLCYSVRKEASIKCGGPKVSSSSTPFQHFRFRNNKVSRILWKADTLIDMHFLYFLIRISICLFPFPIECFAFTSDYI